MVSKPGQGQIPPVSVKETNVTKKLLCI